jgi:hypothetical protein
MEEISSYVNEDINPCSAASNDAIFIDSDREAVDFDDTDIQGGSSNEVVYIKFGGESVVSGTFPWDRPGACDSI